MSIKQVVAVPALLLSVLCLASGAVVAQGETEMTDQQFCEQEARQEGITDATEIKAYVEQCLEDIRQETAGADAAGGAAGK